MANSFLSIVEIHFQDIQKQKEEIDVIQDILREVKLATGFMVYEGKITFHLWSEIKADYTVLDTIKRKLKQRGFSAFCISASEYAETGTKYSYDGQNS